MHSAAAAMPVAVERHRPAVGLDQAAHDGQPQAQAALGAIAALPFLGERVEQARQQLGGDADPAVADVEPHARASPLGVDEDDALPARCTSRRCSAGSPRPATGGCVAVDVEIRRHVDVKPVPALLESGLAVSIALAHDVGQPHALALQLHLAAGDARDVQQIVHQADHVPHLALDDLALLLGAVDRRAASSAAAR